VVALKFRGAVGLADAMGSEMARRVPPALLAGGVLVPVPPDPWRRRRRGLDHALLLTTAVARQCSLGVALALRRTGPAPRQAGQSRRIRTVTGRIAVEAVIQPPPICVLVDDVHTTGATLDACARALIEAGATSVRAMTYARTLPPASGKRMFTSATF
jgi:predicted amidophosphoribosyltransferase